VVGGRLIADYIIQHFPNGGRIVLLTGQPGSSPAIERASGIKDELAKAGPEYKIVAEQTANWVRDQGLTVTQSILESLSSPPDIIVGCDDDMALGALEALKTASLHGKKVAVIGFDATPDGLASIETGQLTATVDQNNGQQMLNAMDMLVSHIRGNTPMKNVTVAPFMVDKSNLQSASRIAELK
jgi:inositol transport system substrate-binding protein